METTKITTDFAELFKKMPQDDQSRFYRECLSLQVPVAVSTVQLWAYRIGAPTNASKVKVVADILRGMGYDVDPETLFKKYPKPVNDAQQEK